MEFVYTVRFHENKRGLIAMKPDHPIDPPDNRNAMKAIAEHHDIIRAYVRKLGRNYHGAFNEHDLDDITQAVFEKILRDGLRSFRGLCPLSAYLVIIARNEFRDQMRAMKTRREKTEHCFDAEELDRRSFPASGPGRGAGFELALEDRDMLEFVKAEAARLPGKQALIFAMIALDGMTQQDAARALNLRQSTVSEHYAKARKLVLSALKRRHPDVGFD